VEDYDEELVQFAIRYGHPKGCMLIAHWHNEPLGMVAYRAISPTMCEMKRMYVKPEFRGEGIALKLVLRLIDKARRSHFEFMRLDTLPAMTSAIRLYRRLGFIEIEPYRPEVELVFMGLRLKGPMTEDRRPYRAIVGHSSSVMP
jgi:ribosomal protein S18 acetylase RimI-like enzyme